MQKIRPPSKIKFGITQFSAAYRKPGLMTEIHQHDEVEINYLLEGSMVYLVAGAPVPVPARQITVFWAAVPHQLTALKNAGYCYWFSLPLPWFLQRNFPAWFMKLVFQGEFLVDAAPHRFDEEFCRQAHEDLRSPEPELVHAAQLEIEAQLRRFILRQSRPPPSTGSQHTELSPILSSSRIQGIRHVQQMAGYVAAHYTERLRVADIAGAVGLHPNYAMNRFRRATGISLLGYIHHHRLFHAKRLLATTDAKIIDVAMESGFATMSRFYETFHRALKCSPKTYRQRCLLGKAPATA